MNSLIAKLERVALPKTLTSIFGFSKSTYTITNSSPPTFYVDVSNLYAPYTMANNA